MIFCHMGTQKKTQMTQMSPHTADWSLCFLRMYSPPPSSRVLGFFLASSLYSLENDKQEEKITTLMDKEFLVEIVSLVGLIEEIL